MRKIPEGNKRHGILGINNFPSALSPSGTFWKIIQHFCKYWYKINGTHKMTRTCRASLNAYRSRQLLRASKKMVTSAV